MPERTVITTTARVLTALAMGIAICSAASAQAVNTLVSPDLFGEQVDVVTPGYMHWTAASGDVVDPDGDANDFGNNFGDHAGGVDNPRFTSHATAYAQGNVADEFVYAQGSDRAYWEFNVPGPGQYVFATRYWRELQDPTTAIASYQSGGQWIDLPPVSNIGHWGGFGNLGCYLIEVPPGQTTVPMRIRAGGGRVLIYRLLLAKRKETDVFLPTPAPTHPSMLFHSADVAAMRTRAQSGPPKRAYDYMLGQMSWYINSLNSGSSSWESRGSSHHVPRSIAQTAFVYVMTGDDTHYNNVIKMIDKVISWSRNADCLVDQQNGNYNVLGRGRVTSAVATAYDWLYDRMTPAERTRTRDFLAEEATRLYIYNETCVGNLESGNWDPWVGAGYAMAGIALRDEHKWPTQWIESMKRIFPLNLHNSGEDFGYFNNGFTKAIDFGMSLKTATGEDLFAPESARLTALMDYRMTLLEPQGGGYPTFGDASSGNDPLLGLVTATYQRDQMAQWYINHLSCATTSQVSGWGWNHMMPVAVVTAYDPTLGEEAPGTPRLQLGRTFADEPLLAPGLAPISVMRTGYGDSSDVQLVMRSGPFYAWHGHPCQGNFVLNAYGDHLVMDEARGGTYGSAPSDFSKTAQAHSQVLVDGKGQVDYGVPVYYDKEAGYTGPLTHSSFVDHVQAEMAVAYRKGPLGTMQHAYRDFLFVRRGGGDAYVVVVDDLQTDSQAHSHQWLLQTDFENGVVTGGANHSIVTGSADLDVITVEPPAVQTQVAAHHDIWRTLTLTDPVNRARAVFLTVLYPRTKQTPSPQVVRIATGQLVGFRMGDELVLFHKGQGSWTYQAIETDARVFYMELSDPQEIKYLITAATTLKSEGAEVFRSDTPVTTTGTFSGSPVDLDPPTIAAWYSAVVHDRGAGEALLEIPDDGSFCEPRSAGINTLVIVFTEPLDPMSCAGALVEVCGLVPNGEELDFNSFVITTDTRGDDTVGVITFDPALPDFARYAVRISGATDVAGNELAGDNDRVLTALEGDVSGDRRVNARDLFRVRAGRTRLIDALDANQARADVTCDGRVNATDLSRVRAKRGRDARGIEDPILDIGTYFESDGLVTIECEKFAENVAQGGHAWEFVTDPPGYSRGGAMRAMPDSGTRIDTGYVSSSPRLDYNVSFETTGTWYVWVRGYAYTPSDDDSCHVGLNGAAVATSDRMGDFPDGDWFWANVTRDGPVATLEISAAGFNEINVWMREDGLVIDKLILTTDSTYVPTD